MDNQTINYKYAGFSAAFTTTILAPLERLRIIYQVQGSTSPTDQKFQNITQYIKSYQKQGLKSFFRGNLCNIYIYTIQKFFQFNIFENVKKFYTPENEDQKWYHKFMIALTSSFFCMCVTYPIDLGRTILSIDYQYKFKTLENCLRQVRIQKYQNMYSGFLFANVSNIPNAIIYMSLIECVQTDQFNISLIGGYLAYTLTYPLDTMRRRMIVSVYATQKNPMKSFIEDIKKTQKGGKWLYNGFSVFFTRNVLSIPLQYSIIKLMCDYQDYKI